MAPLRKMFDTVVGKNYKRNMNLNKSMSKTKKAAADLGLDITDSQMEDVSISYLGYGDALIGLEFDPEGYPLFLEREAEEEEQLNILAAYYESHLQSRW